MKKLAFSIGLITCAATVPAFANSELRGDVDVLLTIGQGCAINGTTSNGVNTFGTVDFGEHSNLDQFIDAESTGAAGGSIALTCNNELAYSIELDDGTNANAGQRRVTRGGLDHVEYDLYQDAARTQRWGTGVEAKTLNGSGSSQPLTIYGRLAAGQVTPVPGDYQDTVRMTISW